MIPSAKVLLCVNSDFGRGNTIGFRFEQIAAELTRESISHDIIARRVPANHSSFVVVPFYKNYLGRFLNALHIYLFPWANFRFIDAAVFDWYVYLVLRYRNVSYAVAHLGEFMPRTSQYLRARGAKILLDVPIGHQAYVAKLRSEGIAVDVEKFSPAGFITRAMRAADLLVAPSPFVVDTINFAAVKIPTTIVPFGANLPSARRENKTARSECVFVFVGSVSLRKGIQYLLAAWQMANLKNAKLILLGRVYPEVKSLIKRFAGDTVVFKGFTRPEPYLSAADVFVFPSLFEGSAKAVYEALSYGLPVITTFNAGSVVTNKFDGFIVPIANAEALAEKIKQLALDPALRARFSNAALQTARQYTWPEYARRVVALYRPFFSI